MKTMEIPDTDVVDFEDVKLAEDHVIRDLAHYDEAMPHYAHKEAFMLLFYQCTSCGHAEPIWNSRDGEIPPMVKCKCGGFMEHKQDGPSVRVVGYTVEPGHRYITDATREDFEVRMKEIIDRYDGTSWEIPASEKPEWLKSMMEDYYRGAPCVKVKE